MKSIQFTKMQGAGNDYIYVDCFSENLSGDVGALAKHMSDRHFGVGGDGLILITPSQIADAGMRMFNADGSEAEMCGNGIRCLAKYVYDHGICRKPTLKIETGAGVLSLELETSGDTAKRVRVDMGQPVLEASQIPTTLAGNPVCDARLPIGDQIFEVTCVSMGNPHCVTFVKELNDDLVQRIGPLIEADRHFPKRVNVEFVQVLSPTEVRQRTWERGSGETLACGTGASAVCVAGALSKRTRRRITVHLLGGDLDLDWNGDDDHVYMCGPAEEVFTGCWPNAD